MKVAIRADASARIGTGHVMRCLALADELRTGGAEVRFLSRPAQGNLNSLIESRHGFPVSPLPPGDGRIRSEHSNEVPHAHWLEGDWEKDAEAALLAIGDADSPDGRADWLLVDHYALDHRWETRMRRGAKRVAVLDDLADRRHDCDSLLDQNFHEDPGARYRALVPEGCTLLLGPAFALIRPEFHEIRARARVRDEGIRRILVFYGGVDPTNETAKALDALTALGRKDIAIDVVVGGLNPARSGLRRRVSGIPNSRFHQDVENMAELVNAADLGLGAGGVASWERCFLGLPSVVTLIAENQHEAALARSGAGALRCLGRPEDVDAESLLAAVREYLDNPAKLAAQSAAAFSLMSGTRRIGEVARMAFANQLPGDRKRNA